MLLENTSQFSKLVGNSMARVMDLPKSKTLQYILGCINQRSKGSFMNMSSQELPGPITGCGEVR